MAIEAATFFQFLVRDFRILRYTYVPGFRGLLNQLKGTEMTPQFHKILKQYLVALDSCSGPGWHVPSRLVRNDDGQVVREYIDICSNDPEVLELTHNNWAVRCERGNSYENTVGDRVEMAIHAWGTTRAEVAEAIDVDENDIRQRSAIPPRLPLLAKVLQVPLAWLCHGGSTNLPADCPIGLFVGMKGLEWQNSLRRFTKTLMGSIPEGYDLEGKQAFIQSAVMSHKKLSRAARRAGGYWQVSDDDGTLVFKPWEPVYRGLKQELSSPDVSPRHPPVFAAWQLIRPHYAQIIDGTAFH